MKKHAIHPRRLYRVNHQFFDVLDTEEKVYWLGFLAADVSRGPNFILLELGLKDKDHLSKLLKALDSNYPVQIRRRVRDGKVQKTAKVRIGSSYMLGRLQELGVGTDINVDSTIPLNLVKHFWRGFFDGDGSISQAQRPGRKPYWNLNFVGTKITVQRFAAFCRTVSSTRAVPIRTGKIWFYRVEGAYVCQSVLRLLYDGASVYLSRKLVLAEQAIAVQPTRRQRQDYRRVRAAA